MTGKEPCEETFGMIGDRYLRCGKNSIVRIQHRGRKEGPYYMCLEHGWHNIKNRNAEAIEVHPAFEDDFK